MQELNTKQYYAVTVPLRPTLVVAGAGSGKTAVLTHRVAWLIEQGIPLNKIFVATFTNKAANEMRERVSKLLGRSVRGLWIGTFHSLCAKILRQHLPETYRKFTIFDAIDTNRTIRHCIRDFDLQKDYKPAEVARRISALKNNLIVPSIAEITAVSTHDETIARLYAAYTDRLSAMNAVDFDDLILITVRMLQEDLTLDFQAVLVDEYQDINAAQRELTFQLTEPSMNIFAVGDPSQSIYKFRGTDIIHTLEFEQDYPGTEVIKLERNYRSTSNILNASNSVIARNPDPYQKKLWTEQEAGAPIRIKRCSSDLEEAEYVASVIGKRGDDQQTAVLYRTNAQGAPLSLTLSKHGIKHETVAHTKFYDRKEIKDILAYMQIIYNQANSIAVERIINMPPRGIGKRTLRALQNHARANRRTLMGAVRTVDETDLRPRAKNAVNAFATMIDTLVDYAETAVPADILNIILNTTGYHPYVAITDADTENTASLNINALGTIAQGDDSLEEFLEDTQLMTDLDIADTTSKVLLMTVHAAKGLEFDHIIVVGAEDGLFPHHRCMDIPDELEEERRLFYVAMTRAKQTLTIISRPGVYKTYGVSRFITEIPTHLKDERTVISEWIGSYLSDH